MIEDRRMGSDQRSLVNSIVAASLFRSPTVSLGVTGRFPAWAGGPDEEPLADPVAECGRQRRRRGTRLPDGQDAPSAEGHDERGRMRRR
jgi:hypothetical protein